MSLRSCAHYGSIKAGIPQRLRLLPLSAVWSVVGPVRIVDGCRHWSSGRHVCVRRGQACNQTMRCKTCGRVTHRVPLGPDGATLSSVNMRTFDAGEAAGVKVRKFDGADYWACVD